MKIGLVRRGYSSTGGAEAYLPRLASALFKSGHEIVLFSDRLWPDEILAAQALRLTRSVLEVSSPKAFASGVRQMRARYECDFLLSLERVWACDAYRAGDGVHRAWLHRRRASEPHWKSTLRWFNPKHRQILALERALFTGGASRVIANSRMVKEEIIAHFQYPAECIEVIYNGVPAAELSAGTRAEVRRELGLAEDDYVLLFAGSGWERKGLKFAIAAMNRINLDHAILLVAGRGNPREFSSSKRVRFLGTRNDMPRLFSAADAFLLPTLYDPFSNACLEALAAGLPVITTAHNGFAEIMEAGTEGEVIVEPCDVEAIARAVEAWASRERRESIRERLRAVAARYSVEENVRRTLAVIEHGRRECREDRDAH